MPVLEGLRESRVDAARLPGHLNPRGGGSRRPHGFGRPTIGRRAARWLIALVSITVVVASVGGYVSYAYFNSKVDRVTIKVPGKRPPAAKPGVENYLLVGTDSRAGTGGSFGDVPGERSDTTMLIHLGSDGSTTALSFPRDTYVTIPQYKDKSGVTHTEHKNKFNSAISDGGPVLLVQTVERLVNMRIDHYVSVDLAGFKAMTDAIGGVDVCIKPSSYRERPSAENGYRASTNTNDPMSGFRGGPGIVHLSGEQGLAFVRQRHGLLAGDLGRIQRQQQFLGAVFRKATTGGVLANPVKVERLLSAATSAITLDKGTSLQDLRKLASRLRGIAAGQIKMQTVPVHAPTRAEGAIDDMGDLPGVGSVQILESEKLDKILAPLGGRAFGVVRLAPADPGGSTTAQMTPQQVTVRVFNGSGTPGVVKRTVVQLGGFGFQAVNSGNASTTNYMTSRVLYSPGNESAAQLVQAAVPGSRLTADPTVGGVQLIIGSSFNGVTTPKLTTATAPNSATASAAGATAAGGAGLSTTAPSPAATGQPTQTGTGGCTF